MPEKFTRTMLLETVVNYASMDVSEISKDWLVHSVCSKFKHDDETEFGAYCRYFTVTKSVEDYFRRLKADDISGEQLTLDGFDHLQQRYPITRRGDIVAVIVGDISDSEIIEQIIPRYERMIAGCKQHIEELERYMSSRNIVAA